MFYSSFSIFLTNGNNWDTIIQELPPAMLTHYLPPEGGLISNYNIAFQILIED